MSWWDDITNYLGKNRQLADAKKGMERVRGAGELADYISSLPPDIANDPEIRNYYNFLNKDFINREQYGGNPLTKIIAGMLDDWVKKIEQYDLKDPAKAKETLAKLTADIMTISGGALAVELTLGAFPNTEGTVAKAKVSELMAWLGFGAVVNAVAHDPVKIGLLRPYQDTLEATFRNRRPGDVALFQAYRTRELTPTKADPEKDIPDSLLTQIEDENQVYYDREIAKWGYSDWFAGALARSATRTPTFGNLTVLARQGLLTRGLAIYSLWGYGMDKLTMKPALDALMKLNDQANYGGFRAMIEPSFTEGDLSEADLVTYYDKIGVPKDVQMWILPRMKKKREAYLLKQKEGAPAKERDLTVSQVQQAYLNTFIDRAHAQNMILALGYSLDETKILLDLAELRRKLPGAATLKRLPLTDYEKAYKNKLIDQAAVLARMEGEYTKEDIALEKKLLEAGKA